jgi:hypothetical protein
MRAQLCTVLGCVALAAGLHGCATKPERRGLDPHALIGFGSAAEIVRAFESRNLPVDSQVLRTEKAEFLFATVYPYSGPNIFDVYCFERIEKELWHLRSLCLFVYSPSMKVELVRDREFINVLHDGEVLFKVGSAAAQERRNRLPVRPP